MSRNTNHPPSNASSSPPATSNEAGPVAQQLIQLQTQHAPSQNIQGSVKSTLSAGSVRRKKDRKSAKEVCEWLNLMGVLLIPLLIGIYTMVNNNQQATITQQNRQEDIDQQQETILKNYKDEMSRLLQDGHLRTSPPGDEVRTVARNKTLQALHQLDGPHNARALQFLHSMYLIGFNAQMNNQYTIIDFTQADLRKDKLRDADLSGVHLRGADLRDADLTKAELRGADLRSANLTNADLRDAHLSNADLRGAHLSNAELHGNDNRAGIMGSADRDGAHPHRDGAQEDIDQQQETILKNYKDEMSRLLRDHHLRTSLPGDEVRTVARNKTLQALHQLDGPHNARALQFLHSMYLIGFNAQMNNQYTIIDFTQADLRKDKLHGADLSGVDLSGADLRGVDLSGADLSYADLHSVNLRDADLSNADLMGADLSNADLSNAELSGTMFPGDDNCAEMVPRSHRSN